MKNRGQLIEIFMSEMLIDICISEHPKIPNKGIF